MIKKKHKPNFEKRGVVSTIIRTKDAQTLPIRKVKLAASEIFPAYINIVPKISTTLRCKKVIVKFTAPQINIVRKWFKLYGTTYNLAIKKLKKFIKKMQRDIKNDVTKKLVTKIPSFEKLRNMLKPKIINNCKCPQHTIDNAIHDARKAYDSAMGNQTAGNIKQFRLRYKKKCRTICLEAQSFSKDKNTFCTTILGGHVKTIPMASLIGIEHDCRLQWNNSRKDPFTLFVPEDRATFQGNSIDTCSLDPGVRTFQTLYDKKKFMDIGKKLPEKMTKLINRINDPVGNRKVAISPKQHNKLKIRLHAKIKNMVVDYHHKLSKWLAMRYATIYLGKISTQSILQSDDLNAMTKQKLQLLRHYTFRQTLLNKAEIYGSKVILVDESYTSKLCTLCGTSNENLAGKKTYHCINPMCCNKMDRDHNAARNIMIKGVYM